MPRPLRRRPRANQPAGRSSNAPRMVGCRPERCRGLRPRVNWAPRPTNRCCSACPRTRPIRPRGMWEAADLQWWWPPPQASASDEIEQIFWIEGGARFAGAVLTDWGSWGVIPWWVPPGSAVSVGLLSGPRAPVDADRRFGARSRRSTLPANDDVELLGLPERGPAGPQGPMTRQGEPPWMVGRGMGPAVLRFCPRLRASSAAPQTDCRRHPSGRGTVRTCRAPLPLQCSPLTTRSPRPRSRDRRRRENLRPTRSSGSTPLRASPPGPSSEPMPDFLSEDAYQRRGLAAARLPSRRFTSLWRSAVAPPPRSAYSSDGRGRSTSAPVFEQTSKPTEHTAGSVSIAQVDVPTGFLSPGNVTRRPGGGLPVLRSARPSPNRSASRPALRYGGCRRRAPGT